jgi:hypothetical protein
METQPLLEARLIPPGSWRAAGSEGTRSRSPSPPAAARAGLLAQVAPPGRRQEPPQTSLYRVQRPRLQLLLSHHLAVTASQKRPHLAAASTRDGRSHRLSSGGAGGA